MKRIDTSAWKRFQIKDVFITHRKMGKIQVPTGANIPKTALRENGTIPRITVTGVNNGIFGYFDFVGRDVSDYRIYSNFISVSFLGTVFYHKECASLDMKVHCLKPIGTALNEYSGTFLVAAIKASLRKSSYADQLSSTLLPTLEIMLPVNGNDEPDFEAMEKYVRVRRDAIKAKIDALQLLMMGGGGINCRGETGGDSISMTRNYSKSTAGRNWTK